MWTLVTQAIWKLFGSYYLLRHQSPRDNSKYGESCVTRVHTTVTKVHGISCRWLSVTIANRPTRVVWTLVTAGWCGARWGRGRRGSSGSYRSARLRRSWPARRRGRAPAEESAIGVRQTTLRVSGPGTLARGVVPVIPSGNQDVRKPVESECFRTVSKSAAKGRDTVGKSFETNSSGIFLKFSRIPRHNRLDGAGCGTDSGNNG